MRKQILLVVSAAIVFFAQQSSAITVSVLPGTQSASVGDLLTVTVDISGLGVGTAPSLSGFDIDIGFDPLILNYRNAVFGDPALGDQLDLSGGGLNNPQATPSLGSVNLYEVSLLDTPDQLNQFQAPSFVFATLFFQAENTGTSAITVSLNPVDGLLDVYGNTLSASVQYGNINVNANPNPIPEPPIYVWLLGALPMFFKRNRGGLTPRRSCID